MAYYYEDEYIQELLEGYLCDVSAYGGHIVEALGFTLDHLDGKDYIVTLFIALELIKKKYSLKENEMEDFNYWKEKQDHLLKAHVIDIKKLQDAVDKILETI